MKKLAFRIIVMSTAVLVVTAPFFTKLASACSLGLGEKKVPDCLR